MPHHHTHPKPSIFTSMASHRAIIFTLVFTFTACSSGGGDNTGVGTQPNQTPEISGSPQLNTFSGKPYRFMPNATDADGDQLNYSAENLPTWALLDTNTGELSGTPEPGDEGLYADIVLSVSDGLTTVELAPFSITVHASIGKRDIIAEGSMLPISETELNNPEATSGFVTNGLVNIALGEQDLELDGLDLKFEFDEDDALLNLEGSAIVPEGLTDYFNVTSAPQARIGFYLGSQINADPTFGITLQDNRYYFVFYIGISTEVEIGNRNGGKGESLTLEPPLNGEIILAIDPLDQMSYYYADTPAGIKGTGESDQGLLPYVPLEDFSGLDHFNGHTLQTEGQSIGVKIFDFFDVVGTFIIKEPQFRDIDWSDPLNSSIEYRAGANGVTSFALSVLSVGVFEFDLAQVSMTFDAGLDRQQMAMQMSVEPDVSWQPDWFSVLPESTVVGNWLINGDGTFSAELSGNYVSTLPPANLNGKMILNHTGAHFSSFIADETLPLTVSATFLQPHTTYTIETEVDISDRVAKDVDESFDRLAQDKQQAYQDYQDAIAEYDFEVSLRGLRDALPGIADNGLTTLNALPGQVAADVGDRVEDEFKKQQQCVNLGLTKVCTPSNSTIANYVSTASNEARSKTTSDIAPFKAAMQNLKARAIEADDESLRQALEDALRMAYDHRSFSKTISVSVAGYTRNERVNKTIIPSGQATDILTAANNAYRIQESSDTKIRLENYSQQFPADQYILEARQAIKDGVKQIPAFNGAGMNVSNGSSTGFIILGQQQYQVDANLLKPVELLLSIEDLIAQSTAREMEEEGQIQAP